MGFHKMSGEDGKCAGAPLPRCIALTRMICVDAIPPRSSAHPPFPAAPSTLQRVKQQKHRRDGNLRKCGGTEQGAGSHKLLACALTRMVCVYAIPSSSPKSRAPPDPAASLVSTPQSRSKEADEFAAGTEGARIQSPAKGASDALGTHSIPAHPPVPPLSTLTKFGSFAGEAR